MTLLHLVGAALLGLLLVTPTDGAVPAARRGKGKPVPVQAEYTAAVYEHIRISPASSFPVPSVDEAKESIRQNLAVFREQTRIAAEQVSPTE